MAGGGHFPDEAVVERELLDRVPAQPIDAAVADVGRHGAVGQQQQAAAGRAHAVEVDAVRPLGVDAAVGVVNGGDDRLARRQVGPLLVGVRNVVGGDLAGEFAGGVGAHAVGHDEEVAARSPVAVVAGERHGERVLIAGAPHPDVAYRCAPQAAGRAVQFGRRFCHQVRLAGGGIAETLL